MKIGTKSLLFGYHQLFFHPLVVMYAYYKLGYTLSIKKICACILHDIGYFGKPNMDGVEGKTHPELGAKVMGWLFGEYWYNYTVTHSGSYARLKNLKVSELYWADKLAYTFYSTRLMLFMNKFTHEFDEYIGADHAIIKAKDNYGSSMREYLDNTKKVNAETVYRDHRIT